MGQNALLHGETLFVIPTADPDHVTLPLFPESIRGYFCGHALLIERPQLALVIYLNEFLAAGGREGDIQLGFQEGTKGNLRNLHSVSNSVAGFEAAKPRSLTPGKAARPRDTSHELRRML